MERYLHKENQYIQLLTPAEQAFFNPQRLERIIFLMNYASVR